MRLKSFVAVVLSALVFQCVSTYPILAHSGSDIESAVPRDGLRFYFEMSSSGFAELAKSNGTLSTLSRALSTGPLKVSTADLAGFVMSNAAALSNTRIAFAGYTDNKTALIIEGPSEGDAERLSVSVRTLVGVDRPGKPATSELNVATRGRLIVAGSQALVSRFLNSSSERSLGEDQEFMKARSRFSNESLFAFIELNPSALGLDGTAGQASQLSQTPAMLAALSGLPYAIALGGSMTGDWATVRALMLNNSHRAPGGITGVFGGLLTSATSSATLDQPQAASFATPGADVFVDLMVDWDKLVDAFQNLSGMLAGAVAAGAGGSQSAVDPQAAGIQKADFLGMLEASLGFSIKRDLIPTLGNEVAVTFSGFSNSEKADAGSSSQKVNGAKKKSPKFMLMVAVRDGVKFEKLLGKLLSGGKGAPQPLTQLPYRGATIKSRKDMAYAITDGFLLIAGSAAEIRRALDAHALGNSLESSPEFRQALSASGRATLQAYLSSHLSKELLDSLTKEVAKSGDPAAQPLSQSTQPTLPIGLSLIPDDDGLLIEANLPANVLTTALVAMFNTKRAPYGISLTPGVGTPGTGAVRPGGRATPRLTDDDLRYRRP